ncbi:MAG TPA: hypothetical protein VFD58_22340 [Blastocatellia bacterium]|nr:hypothetical protein [Blastocatellia bacterium]
MKKYSVAIGIWLLVLIAIFSFPVDLPDIIGLVILSSPLIGIILIGFFFVLLLKEKKKHRPVVAMLLVVLICVALFEKGVRWGASLHLLVNENRYQAIVTQVLSAQDGAERRAICGERCMILSEKPLRVSFHYCHWFLIWRDIVYDPTGAVNEKDILKLHQLNSYLFGAEHLRRDWYLCNFGD